MSKSKKTGIETIADVTLHLPNELFFLSQSIASSKKVTETIMDYAELNEELDIDDLETLELIYNKILKNFKLLKPIVEKYSQKIDIDLLYED